MIASAVDIHNIHIYAIRSFRVITQVASLVCYFSHMAYLLMRTRPMQRTVRPIVNAMISTITTDSPATLTYCVVHVAVRYDTIRVFNVD